MSKEIKFKFYFTNHAPIVFTLDELFGIDRQQAFYVMGTANIKAKKEFIGSRDKDGVDVFDGDIVKSPSGEMFVVGWRDEQLCWGMLLKDTWYNTNFSILSVIGNIIEPPVSEMEVSEIDQIILHNANLYAESQRLIVNEGGWKEEAIKDYTKGAKDVRDYYLPIITKQNDLIDKFKESAILGVAQLAELDAESEKLKKAVKIAFEDSCKYESVDDLLSGII